MSEIREFIDKEVPIVEYYIITPLETYQKRRADRFRAISSANSKYIFFIVFTGDH